CSPREHNTVFPKCCPPPQSEASVNKFSAVLSCHSASSSRWSPVQFANKCSHQTISSLHRLFIFTLTESLLFPFVLLIKDCMNVLPCGATCATHIREPISDWSSVSEQYAVVNHF